jgi:hypothetical protein
MRQIFILHVLCGASIYLIGILGVGLWFLCAAYTLLLGIVMIWQIARLRPFEWGAFAALAVTLLISGIAICTDANPFTPNDPRPGVYPRKTFIWLSLAMFSLLSFVWAVRILIDFSSKLSKFRAVLAIACAIFLYLLSNLGSQITSGKRSYDIASYFYHRAGLGSDINLISYRLQSLRQNRELLIVLLLLTGGILATASCFDRSKPTPTPKPPLDPADTYEI